MWIPIKNKKPKEYTSVLVLTTKKQIHIAILDDDMNFINDSDEIMSEWNCGEVIYWMPLPKITEPKTIFDITKCSGENCPMQVGYDVANCQVKDCPFRTKPINRYDLIRHFTIEQMAEFMREMLDCVSCQNKMMNNNNPFGKEKCNDKDYYKMCNGDYRKCLAVCKNWLESEVE